MFKARSFIWSGLVLLAANMLCPVLAGNLGGKVSFNGSGMPGATVSAQGQGTASTVTNGDGRYALTLQDGDYLVRVTLGGFSTYEKGVTVSGATTLDVALEPAQYEEIMVISSSKVATKLLDSPATISVITPADIENSVTDDFGDMMREMPGVNVVQFSARDINVVSREDSQSLANSQLTLLDGRSIYLDFFGIVLWDFVPTNMDEIKQIEVVRGPASAIWGANAQTGLVNIITKSPRELVGTTLSINAGTFGRDINNNGLSDGNTYGASITHADIIDDTWSYKVSAGYFKSDPWARPTGLVPFDPERGTGGVPFPEFDNSETEQPKIDVRFDQELGEDARITYAAGTAGTSGIVQSGIGPFDIQSGSRLSYGKINYSKGYFKANVFANLLDGDAPSLLTADVSGEPINLVFKTEVYDLELGHALELGDHNFLSYGGNYRQESFELSIAPGQDSREEWGAYVQDELHMGQFRAVVGARFDKFDAIEDIITSPRISLMYQPNEQHTLRLSYNEAFRAPSLIENYLNIFFIAAELDLGLIDPNLAGTLFPVISTAVGNENLLEDSLEAYEISYTGRVGNGLLSLAYYRNDTDQNMVFYSPADAFYTAATPPPGWPLPPIIIDILLGQGIAFPSNFTYDNLGPVRYEGLELSFDYDFNRYWSGHINYSRQDDPEILDDPTPYPLEELSSPPKARYNLAIGYAGNRLFSRLSLTHSDGWFSTDVLDSRYHGAVDDYDMVNFNIGYKWLDNRLSGNLKITNLTDDDIQQHIFADVMKRSIVGEFKIHF